MQPQRSLLPKMQHAQDISTHRLNRLRQFLYVGTAAWATSGLYLLITQRYSETVLCFGEAAIGFGLVTFAGSATKRTIINLFLAASTIGIAAQSILTGGIELSSAPMFLITIILLAAYQLGSRETWTWGAICLLVITGLQALSNSNAGFLQSFRVSTQTDWLISYLILVVFVMLISTFAEVSNDTYAKKLEEASEKLRAGTRKLNLLLGVDSLTKLPNRHQFQKDAEQALLNANRDRTSLAILLIDLNGFKTINDRLGHATGDQVLRDVAVRLTEAVDPSEGKIARLGGDEFTVILEDVPDDFAAALIGGKIVRSISREYRFQGRDLKLGASVGAATFPNDGKTIDELLSHADAAMYTAKENRLGVQMYCPSMIEDTRRRQAVTEKLDGAMCRDEFSLVYQPQVDIRTNRIVGMESLLRWRHGDGTTLSPPEFIAHLENSGEIVEVGRWVLEEACRQAKAWADQNTPVRVSVNVSTLQFRSAGFVDDVWNALEKASLAPDLLDLELTETVFLEEARQAVSNIEMIREAGVSISIDDFGTGYSSLAYLKALPINRLKIDRSFIKDIPDRDDGMIAEAVVNLSHNLGMSVLAEGVDCPAQLKFLEHRCCDEYQGYLFSKPVEPEAALKLLHANHQDHEPNERMASIEEECVLESST